MTLSLEQVYTAFTAFMLVASGGLWLAVLSNKPRVVSVLCTLMAVGWASIGMVNFQLGRYNWVLVDVTAMVGFLAVAHPMYARLHENTTTGENSGSG